MYDFCMRLPLTGWALFYATVRCREVILFINSGPIDFVRAVHITTRLSIIAFMVLVAVVVVMRTRPTGKASGLEPRISAFVGSFATYGMVLFPRHDVALPVEMISTLLILVGTAGAIVALAQLGRSFSIMVEARQLVTTGPYRFVRHPLYLTEQIAVIGLFMQFASAWTAVLLAVQFACQLRRMHNEEILLTAKLPEYAVYQLTTARLIPGIY